MANESEDFLERGLETYCDALRAVRHFQRSVQKTSFDVLTRHLGNLSTALGVPLDPAMIEPYLNPKPVGRPNDPEWKSADEWEGGGWVAVMLPCPQPLWRLYSGIAWDVMPDGSERGTATVDFEAYRVPTKENLLRRVKDLNPPVRFDVGTWSREVYMRDALVPKEMQQLGSKLADLLDEWARFFREIRGLKALDEPG